MKLLETILEKMSTLSKPQKNFRTFIEWNNKFTRQSKLYKLKSIQWLKWKNVSPLVWKKA